MTEGVWCSKCGGNHYTNDCRAAKVEIAPCEICNGDGAVDSGGNLPWGEAICVKCGHCDGSGKEPPPEEMCQLFEMCELQGVHPELKAAVGALILRCMDAEIKLRHLVGEVQQSNATAAPADPSPTPWDYSTWGFYCDSCRKFFDLVRDGNVQIEPRGSKHFHSCGAEARYIGYDRTKER